MFLKPRPAKIEYSLLGVLQRGCIWKCGLERGLGTGVNQPVTCRNVIDPCLLRLGDKRVKVPDFQTWRTLQCQEAILFPDLRVRWSEGGGAGFTSSYKVKGNCRPSLGLLPAVGVTQQISCCFSSACLILFSIFSLSLGAQKID